jgi:predicted dehydrogenase
MDRRDFLKKSTLTTLALASRPILGAEPVGKKYRTALIGCGWWGNNILCRKAHQPYHQGRARYGQCRSRNGQGGAGPNGTLGDWGIHWMDQILWIMDEKYPRKVFSTGGRPIKGPPLLTREEQTSDAPDHQLATFQFENFDVSWEHRQFAGNNAEKGETVGCYFYGTEGTFHMAWQTGWTFYPADSKKPVIHEEPTLHEPDQQNIKELWADLLNCIKTGRKPISDIAEIQRSTNVSLLGMLSYKLGRGLQWDGEKEVVIGDAEANQLLSRKYRGSWQYPQT